MIDDPSYLRLLEEEDTEDIPKWQPIYTIVVIIIMFAVLMTDRVGTDSVMLTALTLFYISGIIDIKEALAGFSSQGLLTVLVLFVVAEGLNKTQALNWYIGKLLGRPRLPAGAQLRVMLPIAALSGFINDTPLVTITLPVVAQWAKTVNLSPRFIMIPLSYAALLGGVCTLIGTSTNLVIAGLLQEQFPEDSELSNLPFLELGKYGVSVTFLGIAYVVFFTPIFLNRGHVSTTIQSKGDADDLLLAARLTPWSPAVGRTAKRSGLRDTGGIYLVRVKRRATGNVHHAVGPDFVLEQGDILYFTGLVETFGEFCQERGLEVVTHEVQDLDSISTHETDSATTTSPLKKKDELAETRNLETLGIDLDTLLSASQNERMRFVHRTEDIIRGEDVGPPLMNESSIVIAIEQEKAIIAINVPDRSGLLLDISKCLARLQLELHHTEAAVKHGRSLSIWRCECSDRSEEYVADIYTALHALFAPYSGSEAVKERGHRVVRAKVLINGRLVGTTAAQMDFRRTYKAAIVAIQRDGQGMLESLSTTALAEGDILILQASQDSPLLQLPPTGFYEGDEASSRKSGFSALLAPLNFNASTSTEGEGKGGIEMGETADSVSFKEKEAVWRDLFVMKLTNDISTGIPSKEFLSAMRVQKSGLVGKTAAAAGINNLPGIFLVSLERVVPVPDVGGGVTSYVTVALSEPLQIDDILWFSGTASAIGDLRKIPGLVSFAGEEVEKINEKAFNRLLVQAVVARKGPLVGKTIKEVRFRTVYGAAVIAVQREGKRVHEYPGNIELHAGDVLLLEAGPSFMSNKVQHDRSFALVAEIRDSSPPRLRMLIPALFLTIGAYACYMAKLSTLWGCAMVAAILMVLLGILSEAEARAAIKWEIYLTIASAFGIGTALVNSGVAGTVAAFLVRCGDAIGIGDAGLLGAVYLSTVMISQLVSNNAAAALIFPIAITAATTAGTDIKLMSYNIMLAASAAFMTPFGYQTNLMVMGPGGYTTTDFLIFGTPMQIVLLFGTTIFLVTPFWICWLATGALLALVAFFRISMDLKNSRKTKIP
ncbi:TrkA-C domain containing protein [Nitzschia inconspicua]|uniref:TrkA-C domain containing protein n=1 Tax=Nitzschia inconspicua TaxID=303405 RepID=A0A9K3P791_9STRA|nr:TrkA-C domain containing protein [Nitzschia inconspicua]KAG7354002.1 TrkA-C domain containing protein [Nitzschia inconspicua]